jgi:hypothetical protein
LILSETQDCFATKSPPHPQKGKIQAAVSPLPKTALTAKTDTTPSAGGLKSIGKATAEDSSYVDNENKMKYLYGKAHVTYEDFELGCRIYPC